VSTDQTSSAAAAAGAAPNASPVDPAIVRLNAFDGLFLRAEHLNRMQDYPLQLSLALGRAQGSGVVEGFGVGLDGDTVVADPGLAIDPSGRPLRTRQALRASLSALTPTTDSVWWVELVAEELEFGDEPVRGVSCAEPGQGCCGGDGTRSGLAGEHPYLAEGAHLRLREEKLTAPASEAELDRRGWVAHHVFDQERPPLGVWPGVVPTGSAAGGTRFLERGWGPLPAGRGEGEGRPDDAVPLALLMPATDVRQTWELDVWTARRDLGDSRPMQSWQPLLALRPWPVFIAQVLQFQQWLAARLGGAGPSPMTVADLSDALGRLTSDLRSRRTARPLAIADELQGMLRGSTTGMKLQNASLPQLGLRWLPPAAFLPVAQELPPTGLEGPSVRSEVARLLGRTAEDAVPPVVCLCGPWDVGHALEAARHADRIDLTDQQAELRVLVPLDGKTRLTDWVLVEAADRVRCLTRDAG
jgi:hypothetical protein